MKIKEAVKTVRIEDCSGSNVSLVFVQIWFRFTQFLLVTESETKSFFHVCMRSFSPTSFETFKRISDCDCVNIHLGEVCVIAFVPPTLSGRAFSLWAAEFRRGGGAISQKIAVNGDITVFSNNLAKFFTEKYMIFVCR